MHAKPRFPSVTPWLRLLILLASLAGSSVGAQTVYKFGVAPQFEPRRLAAIWMPILAELEKRTGLKFEMVGSARIPEFETEFQAGRYDFAYMNPFHAVLAMRAQNYVPLIRDGADKLYGILVTSKDGPIKSVQDLKGRTIAFPSPNALGASLLLRSDLDRLHHIRFTPAWSQTHTSAYLNAATGRADAAGGVMSTFGQQPAAVRDKLRILMETERVNPHPVVAHRRVPASVREKVRLAFHAMATTAEGAALLAAVPIRQVVDATEQDYADVARMRLEKYYVKGGE